jgi:hypothetical protein
MFELCELIFGCHEKFPSYEHPDLLRFETFEISIARFRKPGDHGCVSTTLDPWLCVPVFQQVCDLSVRFCFKVQVKTGLAFARPADENTIMLSSAAWRSWLCFHNFRPMTLRRCFSTGLRFVGYFPVHSLAHE